MSTTKPLAILLAVLMATTGLAAAVGSTYDTGTDAYAMDVQLDDGSVTVTVTNGDAGVENASVSVGDHEGETDANGTATFERPDDESEDESDDDANAEASANATAEADANVDDAVNRQGQSSLPSVVPDIQEMLGSVFGHAML